MDLFRKKVGGPARRPSPPRSSARLHTFDLTMLGIGAIIGTGIFVLTGKGALTAGPALMVSFLLAAVCCGFAGLCYAEFASMAPVSGSAYSYAYLAFGELIAFVIGWDLILEYALQAATVSAGWSGYFNKLLEGFGLHLPVELTAAYGTNPNTTTYFNLPGFVIVLLITWVLSIGINQTKKANDIMVLIKLAIIVLFIVCVIWYVNPSNWKPFAPYGIYQFQPGLDAAVWHRAGRVDRVLQLHRLRRRRPPPPRRPSTRTRRCRAASCISLAVSTDPVHRHDAHHDRCGAVRASSRSFIDAPVAGVILEDRPQLAGVHCQSWRSDRHDHGDAGAAVRPVPHLLCHEPRRPVPEVLRRSARRSIAPRSKGHGSSVLLTAIAGGFININVLFELVNIGTLSAFIIVSAGILWMRKTQPDAHRGFRAPGVPFTPILRDHFLLHSDLPV